MLRFESSIIQIQFGLTVNEIVFHGSRQLKIRWNPFLFFKERPLFFGLAAPFIVVVSELLRDWYKFLRKIMILFPVMRFVGCHELVDSILLFI